MKRRLGPCGELVEEWWGCRKNLRRGGDTMVAFKRERLGGFEAYNAPDGYESSRNRKISIDVSN
jgi:hypothetical protein